MNATRGIGTWLAITVMVAWLAGCGTEPQVTANLLPDKDYTGGGGTDTTPPTDTVSDTGGVADTLADATTDPDDTSAGGGDNGPVADAGAADATDGDTDVVVPDPRLFAQESTGLGKDFVYKGVWAGEEGWIVAVGNDGVAVTRDPGGAWEIVNEGEGSDLLNAIDGVARDDLFAVGIAGTILTGGPNGFGEGTGCVEDADCDNGDSCTVDTCVDAECHREAAGGPGCCGEQVGSWGWDSGTLEDWSVQNVTNTLMWQPVSKPARFVSPSYAMYFGDPNKNPPNYDTTQIEAADLVSPFIDLPLGSASVKFQVWMNTEADPAWDTLTVSVNEQAVWSKSLLGAVPTNGFVPVEADISQFNGQQVRIRIRFDTVDGSINATEGVYIDDVVVDTTCEFKAGASLFPTLWGVDAIAEDEVYAVGLGGTIARYDGNSWKPETGTGNNVTWGGIFGSDEATALVGTEGSIMMVKGGELLPVTSPTTSNLWDVWTDEEGTVWWAVGDNGTLLRGEDGVWTEELSPTLQHLNAILGTAADDIYAVGSNGVVIHYDGTSWASLTLPDDVGTNNFRALWIDDGGRVTVTGANGALLEGNAVAGWDFIGALSPGTTLQAAWGSGANYRVLGGDNAALWHYNFSWNPEPAPVNNNITDMWGFAPDDIWAVGLGGVVIHWNGALWEEAETPASGSVRAIWGRTGQTIIAAGDNGEILEYNGEVWELLAQSTDQNLRGVHGFDNGDVWAVGANGTIMRRGQLGWVRTRIDPQVYADGSIEEYTQNLLCVWGATPDEVWASGETGALFRYDGTSWKFYEEAGFGRTLRGIWGLAADDLWAVGNSGHVIHYDGERWSEWYTGAVATLYSIHGSGPEHVVAVGDIGTVLTLRQGPEEVEEDAE